MMPLTLTESGAFGFLSNVKREISWLLTATNGAEWLQNALRNVVPLSSVRQACLTRASSVSDVTRTVCIGVRETSARCKETIRIADGTYLHDPRRRAPHSQSSFRRSIEVTNEIICIFLLVYLRVCHKFHTFAPQKHNI